jgi:hypothetical protein
VALSWASLLLEPQSLLRPPACIRSEAGSASCCWRCGLVAVTCLTSACRYGRGWQRAAWVAACSRGLGGVTL